MFGRGLPSSGGKRLPLLQQRRGRRAIDWGGEGPEDGHEADEEGGDEHDGGDEIEQ